MSITEQITKHMALAERGHTGAMQYVADHFGLRVDPGMLAPGARPVGTL